jgi:hypothetical protein
MSREILTALSFHDDFKGVKYSGYSSNTYPRSPYSYETRCEDENMTSLDYVKAWVSDVLNGAVELPKTNKLSIYVSQLRDDIEYVSLWDKDMRGKWEHDKNDKFGIVWLDEEAKIKFEEYQNRTEQNISYIAYSFMNDTLKKHIKDLKSKKYVLKNGSTYIVSYSKKSYRYTFEMDKAKVFNGIDIEFIPKFFKERFDLVEVK